MLKRAEKICEHRFTSLGKYYTVYKSKVTPYKTFLRERFICDACKTFNDEIIEVDGKSIIEIEDLQEQNKLESKLKAEGYLQDYEMINNTKWYSKK